VFEEDVADHLYFLYYPSRRHQPPALQALVEALRV
jgi:hypothetical protein